VAARYPDIDFIDVVNEPLHDPPNAPGNGGGNYIEALGGGGASGWEWILNAFRMARAKFPHAKLLINEYSVTNDTAQMQRYIGIIQLLQAEHLIDGVGVQGHAFETRTDAATQKSNLDLLATTGLPIYISELDIDGPTDEVQLADYQRIFPVFWEHPAVQGITLWGFRPGHWRTAQGAYIVLDNGAERPAMKWLQAYVGNHVPLVTVGQKLSIDAGSRYVIGSVVATDADATIQYGYATLQNWQIGGGNAGSIFGIDPASGAVRINRPLLIDFRRSSYTLQVTVGDGAGTSAPEPVTIVIPNKLKMCVRGHDVVVPKVGAYLVLWLGGSLGVCSQ
jgi:endo-1,4-beta-xylanase